MPDTSELSLPLMDDQEYRPLAGPLYHYTSIDALLSIVEEKCLRATSVHFLNDASESEVGLVLMREVVEQTLRGTVPAIQREFLEFLQPWLSHELLNSQSIFVLCFSEARNQLSQWRGYAPYGRGVCIGFHSVLLGAQAQSQGWRFQSCRYNPESQRTWVSAILNRMLRESAQDHPADKRLTHFGGVLERATPDLLHIISFIKNEAFSEEREWRFISPPIPFDDGRVKFRPGKYSAIPFVEFRLTANPSDRLALAELIIGPSPAERASRAAVIGVLQRNAVSLVAHDVPLSKIPYREL